MVVSWFSVLGPRGSRFSWESDGDAAAAMVRPLRGETARERARRQPGERWEDHSGRLLRLQDVKAIAWHAMKPKCSFFGMYYDYR